MVTAVFFPSATSLLDTLLIGASGLASSFAGLGSAAASFAGACTLGAAAAAGSASILTNNFYNGAELSAPVY